MSKEPRVLRQKWGSKTDTKKSPWTREDTTVRPTWRRQRVRFKVHRRPFHTCTGLNPLDLQSQSREASKKSFWRCPISRLGEQPSSGPLTWWYCRCCRRMLCWTLHAWTRDHVWKGLTWSTERGPLTFLTWQQCHRLLRPSPSSD